MRIFIVLFFFLSSSTAFSQIGIHFKYQNLDSELWKTWTNRDDLFSSSYEIGIDYWLRLKNYRVEFTPEFYHYRSRTNLGFVGYRYAAFGIAGNTNFYFLDFMGDCDCPTFSKDGNFISKGLYLSVAPHLELQNKHIFSDVDPTESSRNIAFGGSIGVGLDIGLTDLITLSPFVRYKYLPDTKWDALALQNASPGQEIPVNNLGFFQFGVRLGFRPDYIREQNKYRFRN